MLTTNAPHIILYQNEVYHKPIFGEPFTVVIKLVIRKPNDLFLLYSSYENGWSGRENEKDEVLDLGVASSKTFKEIQQKINKTLKGKFKKLHFNIEKINNDNKLDSKWYIHGMCDGEDPYYGRVTYQMRYTYDTIEEVNKALESYSDYDILCRKLYIE